MKKLLPVLLVLALLLGLCACGGGGNQAYRIIETIGTKQYGTVCRAGDRTAQVIDAAMSVLAANGTLSSLSLSWLGQDLISLEGDINALNELQEELQPRKLIVGVEADLKPIAYQEDGQCQGMSVEIAKAIGQLLGWEVSLQPIGDGDIGTQLSAGNIDCALGFGTESVSREKYAVGQCYMESQIAVAVYAGSAVDSLKDLKGQRIGTICDPSVQAALSASEKVTKYASGATVYLSTTRCMTALEKGWCGAVALDTLTLSQYFQYA